MRFHENEVRFQQLSGREGKTLSTITKEVIMGRWKVGKEVSIFHSSFLRPGRVFSSVDRRLLLCHCKAEKLIKDQTTRMRFLSNLVIRSSEFELNRIGSRADSRAHFKRRHPIVHYFKFLRLSCRSVWEQVSSANDYTLIFWRQNKNNKKNSKKKDN